MRPIYYSRIFSNGYLNLIFQTRMTGSISLKLVSGANRLVPLRESKVGFKILSHVTLQLITHFNYQTCYQDFLLFSYF